MTKFSKLLTFLFCATALAACVTENETPSAAMPETGMARLTGEATSVAKLTPALASKGLTMQPMPDSRTAAIARFCSGGAEALVLTSAFTDSETDRCAAAGGHWSAVFADGMPTWLAPNFKSNFDTFNGL
ncbi:hypothetical protein [Falsihalocynthiibacter arcticus]|nr:hypothetical protein [Falsihalocynthiibacter arcticus]